MKRAPTPTPGWEGEEEKLCQGKLFTRGFGRLGPCLPSPVATVLPCQMLSEPEQQQRTSRAAVVWGKRLGLDAKTDPSLS